MEQATHAGGHAVAVELGCGCHWRQRQAEAEATTLIRHGLDPDPPTVTRDNFFADIQAQTHAAEVADRIAVRLELRIENVCLLLVRDADALIDDDDARLVVHDIDADLD